MDASLLDLRPSGADLFEGFEDLIRDLSEEEESTVSGGRRSISRSRLRRRRQRSRRQRLVQLRLRRRRRGRSISFSNT